MKNTYIIFGVLVLIVAGVLVFKGKGSTVQAPATDNGADMSGARTTGYDVKKVEGTGAKMADTSTGAVKEFTISGQNFSFTPNAITVKKGDKVKITFNNTSGFHDFKIDEFGLATKQAQAPYNEVLEFTADKAGTFQYYCSVGSHRSMGMFGTLTVTE